MDGTERVTEKMDAFLEGKYVSADICDIFYKVNGGFLNENHERHVGVGIYPVSGNRVVIHFLKFNTKNDKIKIDSARILVMCPITECNLKNVIELAKLKKSDEGEESDYIQ